MGMVKSIMKKFNPQTKISIGLLYIGIILYVLKYFTSDWGDVLLLYLFNILIVQKV